MADDPTERLPLWLAVALVVAISIPYGTLLGTFSIALWAAFISWAEYFAFGASTDQLKWIYGLFPLGALTMAIFAVINNYFVDVMGMDLIVSSTIWLFIIVAGAVYMLTLIPQGMDKSLAFFNGISIFLALYFAGIPGGPGAGGGPLVSGELAWAINPWIQFLWVSLAGVFGGFLGWFNIEITFPAIDGEPVAKAAWEWVGIIGTVAISVVLFALYHPWVSILSGSPTQYAAIVGLVGVFILGIGWKAMSSA